MVIYISSLIQIIQEKLGLILLKFDLSYLKTILVKIKLMMKELSPLLQISLT
jgi:hypothetical protein